MGGHGNVICTLKKKHPKLKKDLELSPIMDSYNYTIFLECMIIIVFNLGLS